MITLSLLTFHTIVDVITVYLSIFCIFFHSNFIVNNSSILKNQLYLYYLLFRQYLYLKLGPSITDLVFILGNFGQL